MTKIYLSSTYSDLIEYREAVYRALRQMRHDVVAMEDYVAADERPLAKCLADVAACDIYVGLFAWRYGYVPAEDNPEERSITELEYQAARRQGKPCLIFLLEETAEWPKKARDTHTGDNEGGQRIQRLREELSQEKLVSFFATPDDLAAKVAVAVYHQIVGSMAIDEDEAAALSAALARLAAMPAQDDEPIPGVAPLPTGSRMVLPRNDLFVGREADLRRLATALKGGEQTAAIGQIAAATGLGGIGKTQLASAFVHRYGQYFVGGVFWLSFADPAAIGSEVAECGGPDCLALWDDPNAVDVPTQIKLVQAKWREPTPRLLVFDNCEEEELLARWRRCPWES